MPSVGMRRRTRVLEARVLRSGRRLWMEPYGNNKHGRAVHGDNKCAELLKQWADKREDVGAHGVDDWHEFENNISARLPLETIREECIPAEMDTGIDKKFGLVYSRKRKIMDLASHALSEDSRFGRKFVRRGWKKRSRAIESFGMCRRLMDSVHMCGELGISIHQPSRDFSHWVSSLLLSMLDYITRVRIGIRRVYTLLQTKPLFSVYSSLGVFFFQDAFISRKPGVCIISGCRSSIPLLYLTFPAIPSLFMHMQTTMHLRCAHLTCLVLSHKHEEPLDLLAGDIEETSCRTSWNDFQEYAAVSSEISSGRMFLRSEYVTPGNDYLERWKSSQPAAGLSNTIIRSMQSQRIQKRRSCLARRKGKSVSSEFPAMCIIERPDTKSSIENVKEAQYASQMATQSESTPVCSATLLVTETDKCYREKGVTISLESTISYCFLAIKKDRSRCYSLIAQKVMKPSSSNRFTHSVVWGETGDWKLEFPSKKDWMIFKELYKQCFERNNVFHAAIVIPIPRVQDVPYPNHSYCVPFVRPDSYITTKNDELSRALENKYGNYDMDSDDEKWLAKLNGELCAGKVPQEMVTPDTFELVINALEKGFHCNPDENFGEQTGYEFCEHVANDEVFKAIRNYWIQKRKQRRAALIRVFQLHQPRRSQVIPKSILRKKRSFKRQGNPRVSDKQISLLQEISGEREATELQTVARKVDDAAVVADVLEELAIVHRQKAQNLTVNADLITYKALMALRIAEAAQVSDAMGAFTSIFLA